MGFFISYISFVEMRIITFKSMFKVACVIYIELTFKDRLFYNLIILIKKCKVPYRSSGKAPLFLRNQVFCLKN